MFDFEGRRPKILEKLVKALFEWLASLWYEMVDYILGELLELFNVNLSYFAERVPVIDDIANIFVAVGWALLIGNLAFQAMRSMVSGVGIEAEEPARLFLRTAMFSFLLLVSRQICDIGLGLSSIVMEMLQVPDAITFEPFGEDTFDTLPNAGWIFVIIINIVIQWQLLKLFFEVAERYVILCVLTYCAPLAFAMGGSKSTAEIFRGWLRMFASMCVLMVFNLVFVKLTLSALSTDPNGAAIIPWTLLIVGIVRMAKKMDGIILRIGMNPALTGDPLGARFPGALTAMTLRAMASIVTRTAARHTPGGSRSSSAGMPPHGSAASHGPFHNPARNTGFAVGSRSTAGTQVNASGSRQSLQPSGSGRASIDPTAPGADMVGAMAVFQNRYGADNAANMRQVRQAISIDADDFAEEAVTGGSVTQNNSVTQTVSGARVTPVMPPLRSVPADFGYMEAPEAASGHPPVMPGQTPDTWAGSRVSPVTPPHIPRPPEQVQMPGEHSASIQTVTQTAADTAAERGAVSSGQGSDKAIAAVMPPAPPQVQENNLHKQQAGSDGRAKHPPVQPPAPVLHRGVRFRLHGSRQRPPRHSRQPG